MITILSVNYNAKKWIELLVKSAIRYTPKCRIVIVDNVSKDGSEEWLRRQKNIYAVSPGKNIGHGPGLDLGLNYVHTRYCMVMDPDAHFQRHGWLEDMIEIYQSRPQIKLIAAGGRSVKPIHPCVSFFETEFFKEHGLKFAQTKNFDVGRKLYSDIYALKGSVVRLFPGYENEEKEKFYAGAWGDEYYIHGKPTFYHNWYASRMYGRDKVDSLGADEFEERQKAIFEHPLVKNILEERY